MKKTPSEIEAEIAEKEAKKEAKGKKGKKGKKDKKEKKGKKGKGKKVTLIFDLISLLNPKLGGYRVSGRLRFPS